MNRSNVVQTTVRIVVAMALTGVIALLTHQIISLSAATSGALSALAKSSGPAITNRHVPSDAEVERFEACSRRIDTLANNLSNAQTQGFKRRRVELNQGPAANGEFVLDMSQGALASTGGNLDLAITGDGFFHIKISPTVSDGTAYTRCGALYRNKNGDLVVGIGDGYELIPPINVPPNTTNIAVAQDGTVTFTAGGTGRRSVAGQIQLCRFVNPQALGTYHTLFTETTESGPPIIGAPGDNGTGELEQGFLEESNVDPVKEWAMLLQAEHSLQLTSQVLQVADRSRQTIAELERQ